MGIKDCDLTEQIADYPKVVWRARRIKKYEDVIDGEKWEDYGFKFSTR